MVVPSNTWETTTMTPAMDTTPMEAMHEQRRGPMPTRSRFLTALVAVSLMAITACQGDIGHGAPVTDPVDDGSRPKAGVTAASGLVPDVMLRGG